MRRCEIMPSSSSRRIAGESKIPGSKFRPSIPRRRSCCCRSAPPNSCSVIFCPPTLATSPTPAVSRWVHWIPQKANGGTIISASTNCRRRLCLVTKSNMVSLDEKRRTAGILAERTGLEPATPGVTGRYSNQLNYRSAFTLPRVEWWVLTGSNRRHSPCKGDALPAELSTPSREYRRAIPARRATPEGLLVYCILQGFSRTEFRNPCRLDLDFHTGLRIAPRARRAPAYVERSETDQGDHAALLHRSLDCGDSRVEGAARSGFRDVGGFGDVIDDFQLVHFGPLGVRLVMCAVTAPAQRSHDRGLSKDQSPGAASQREAARARNRALLIPRSTPRAREAPRARFAIYSNCKSTVSSVHGSRVEFFSTARRAPAFSCRRGCGVSENSGGRARGATRSALHQSSE